MSATPEVRAAAVRAVRDQVRIGPLGPNASSILAAGGPTSLTPTEAEFAVDAVLAVLAEVSPLVSPVDETGWYVHCGCSAHGDHLGCEAGCSGISGCVHPVGRAVTAPTEEESNRRHDLPLVSPRTTPAAETARLAIRKVTRVLGEHRLVSTSPGARQCSCGFLLQEPDWSTETVRLERHRAHQAAQVFAALAASPADADTAEHERLYAPAYRGSNGGVVPIGREVLERECAESEVRRFNETPREHGEPDVGVLLATFTRTPWVAVSSPVAANGEEVDHFPTSATTMRGTSAVCTWCGELFESEEDYREHERVMVRDRRAREAVAATSEEESRG